MRGFLNTCLLVGGDPASSFSYGHLVQLRAFMEPEESVDFKHYFFFSFKWAPGIQVRLIEHLKRVAAQVESGEGNPDPTVWSVLQCH